MFSLFVFVKRNSQQILCRGGGGGVKENVKKIARSTKAKILFALRNVIEMDDVRNQGENSHSQNLY